MIRFQRDVTTDGRTLLWLALDDSLPGCMAQGHTKREARAELVLARHEYLQSLADDGLLAESKSAGADVSYTDTFLCAPGGKP